MKTKPILRERKKARVRETIIREAVELFERQGFEQTTVEQIVDAAEVSARTFFRYFPNKEAVMFPYHAGYVERFRCSLQAHRRDGSPLQMVQGALQEMAELYTANRETHLRHQLVISASPALLARSLTADAQWEDAIAEAWLDGRRGPAAQMQARLVAGAVMGAINAVMARWYASGCRKDLWTLGKVGLELLSRGMEYGAGDKALEPGVKRLNAKRSPSR